jgi:septal ring factor EnvC (AmiA/AmiB activator)
MDQATQDALNNLNASIDAATTRVQATQAEVKDLRDTVAKLQAQIDAGNADPALVDALTNDRILRTCDSARPARTTLASGVLARHGGTPARR